MNKSLGVLLLVVVTAFIFFITFKCNTSSHGRLEGSTFLLMKHNRKLKERYDTVKKQKRNNNNFSLEDYHLIDPVPSSKTIIRHKPIAHGSPLMPYIPRPPTPPSPPNSPNPSPPKNDGSPGGPH